MHGILSSSDCWILNGADNSMAYILSNAGYDVWLGNARGNTYSKDHAKLSSWFSTFWDFSWDEIAMYDLPAMFDYVRYFTGAERLHYVAHSQGTTVLFALLSAMPKYNDYIETAQMLAPVVFAGGMKGLLLDLGSPVFGSPNYLSKLIESHEFLPSTDLIAILGETACRANSPTNLLCSNILFLIGGSDSVYLNYVSENEVFIIHRYIYSC